MHSMHTVQSVELVKSSELVKASKKWGSTECRASKICFVDQRWIQDYANKYLM